MIPVEQPLNEEEQEKAKQLAAARAHIIHEVVRQEGDEELHRSSIALVWSGLAAGLSMGFSMVAEGLLRAGLPDARWTPLVAKLGYTVGFLIVILGKQQLYTENTLTPVVPFMSSPSVRSFGNLMRIWGIVLVTNLAGAWVFAAISSGSDIFPSDVKAEFMRMGSEALNGSFGELFLRGIFGGWLIALIGWILGGISGDGLAIVFGLSYLVGLGHFSHVVAGSVDTLFLVAQGALPWSNYFAGFLLPTLLGNTIGGVALVAILNHAQAVSGRNT